MTQPAQTDKPTAGHPLFKALANATTSELLWALGEILEPSSIGPFANSYGGNDDADTDAFVDAIWPVTESYRKAYASAVGTLDRRPFANPMDRPFAPHEYVRCAR